MDVEPIYMLDDGLNVLSVRPVWKLEPVRALAEGAIGEWETLYRLVPVTRATGRIQS